VAFANKGKHVYAFEPNIDNFKLLKLNTQYNDNITLFNEAVSNSNGTTYIERYNLAKVGNYGECRIKDSGLQCKKITIDSYVSNNKLPIPYIIKIDVEGHEWEVFQGMEQTIKNYLPIIFFEAHHCELQSICNMLNDLNYQMYWSPCSNYNPNNFKKNMTNIFGEGGVMNMLAIPPTMTITTSLAKVETTQENNE
jgi:FkbM family methyltransferase